MKSARILCISALFTSLVAYQIWKVTWEDFFMWGMTLKDVLLAAAILKLGMITSDYWLKKIAWVLLSFHSIDMLDEWFGTPLGGGYNEYITAGVCAILVFKEELWLDKIFTYLSKRLYIFDIRFWRPMIVLFMKIKPILLTKKKNR